MVGHKKFLPGLINQIKDAGAKSYGTTEFFQGHTSRWGLAWTFCDGVWLNSIDTGKVNQKSIEKPIIYKFSHPEKYSTPELLYEDLRYYFKELHVSILSKFFAT